MTVVDTVLLFALPVTLLIGIWLGHRVKRPPTDENLFKFMDRLVNQEELEERQRLLKVKMARANRRTIRFDGGPNAKVMRMRIRPGTRRPRKDRHIP